MGYFQDQFISKEEDSSTASDMNDSAYMSQPDTSRRGTARSDAHVQMKQDSRAQSYGSFYPDLFSPALSSSSSHHFSATTSDLPQMALPTSESDSGRDYNGVFPYSRIPAFDFMADTQGGWSSNDSQTYSGPFAVNTIDASSLMFQQPSLMSNVSPITYHNGTQRQMPIVEPTRVSTPNSVGATNTDSRFYPSSMMSPSTMGPHQPMYVMSNDYYNFPSSDDASDMNIPPPTQPAERPEDDDEALSPSNDQAGSGIEDSETTKLARTHPLYQATPGADDLYHCPHEGEAGCGHKPTKLKCNYDKYVDSHLRPFRCKVASCANTPFSSTACLLRHEREAHGMHGHGSKPHLCTFPDCERSAPGNGFPRRYNLYDHMKRVHDFTGPASPLEPENATLSGGPQKRQAGRKRKASTEESSEKRQKVSKPVGPSEEEIAAKERATRQLALDEQLVKQRKVTLELLGKANNDLATYEQFFKAVNDIKETLKQIQELGSG